MAVLHVRVPDADFRSLQTTQPALCLAIESRVLPIWDRRVAVLSNNPGLRAALCERYGFHLIEAESVHLGACDVSDQAVRDTLVDFALICSASHVFSHSAYGWKSGFSYWAAAIHGIAFESLRAERTHRGDARLETRPQRGVVEPRTALSRARRSVSLEQRRQAPTSLPAKLD